MRANRRRRCHTSAPIETRRREHPGDEHEQRDLVQAAKALATRRTLILFALVCALHDKPRSCSQSAQDLPPDRPGRSARSEHHVIRAGVGAFPRARIVFAVEDDRSRRPSQVRRQRGDPEGARARRGQCEGLADVQMVLAGERLGEDRPAPGAKPRVRQRKVAGEQLAGRYRRRLPMAAARAPTHVDRRIRETRLISR